jgi:hypothetical protein
LIPGGESPRPSTAIGRFHHRIPGLPLTSALTGGPHRAYART